MMAHMPTLREHRTALIALLVLCCLAAGLKLVYLGTTPNSDYDSYIETAKLFSGLPAQAYPARILKPLAPLGVAALAPAADFPAAFEIEMMFCYLALALAVYWLAWEFFKSKRLALFGALLVALSYPVLHYGVDLYTETGALLFYVLSLALTLLYVRAPSKKLLVANALVIGIGFLWKEYSVVAGIIFAVALLLERVDWQRRVRNLAYLAALALAPSVVVQLWVYLAFHYTYLDWYRIGGTSGFKTEFTLFNLLKSFAALLTLAWLLVPFGLAQWKSMERWQQRFLAIALPVPFICLTWGFVSSRLFYVVAPAFVLVALAGIRKWPVWAQYAAVGICLAAGIFWLVLKVSPAPL